MTEQTRVSFDGLGFGRIFVVAVMFITMTACVSMPVNDSRIASSVLDGTDDTALGAGVTAVVGQHNGKTGILLLDTGHDAFVARAVLAAKAERSLDLQYYLFHRDLSGRLLLEELLKAADRGVRVRLLVDDMDMAQSDLGVAILDAHPNMEVRLFNPFARNRTRLGQLVSRFGSVTRRMHNKSFTADNQLTIIGGRNVGDEYFGVDESLAFADMDVLLAGPAAKEVSKSFDLYWNSALSYNVGSLGESTPSNEVIVEDRRSLSKWAESQQNSPFIKALRASDLNRNIENNNVNYEFADVKILYDLPEKITSSRDQQQLHMAQYLWPYFENAKQEVLIISPYFVPGKKGTRSLCDMQARGVSVGVLTNSLASTDVSLVHAGYLRYRKKLLKCGVKIFEANERFVGRDTKAMEYQLEQGDNNLKAGLSRTSLHAKMFVFDRQYTFVGSLNLDPRSLTENTEIGAIIDSAVIGNQVARDIISRVSEIAFTVTLDARGKIRWDGIENGKPIRYTREPHTSFFKRLGTQIMRILPIESQI